MDDWLTRFQWNLDAFRRIVNMAAAGRLQQHDLDEIQQEVFIRVHRSFMRPGPHRVQTPEQLPGYVYQVARHLIVDWLARKARERTVLTTNSQILDGGQRPVPETGSASGITRWSDIPAETQAEMLSLIPPDNLVRHVLELHLQGLNGVEIAHQLGPSTSTLSRRLKEAMAFVRLRRPELLAIIHDVLGGGATSGEGG